MDKEQLKCIEDVAGIDVSEKFVLCGEFWEYVFLTEVNEYITRLWFKKVKSSSPEWHAETFYIDVRSKCYYPKYNSLTKENYDETKFKTYYNRWYRNHVRSPKERKSKEVEKTCKNCGKKFVTHMQRKQYCCDECYTEYTKKKYLENRPKPVTVKRVCPNCGKEFETGRGFYRFCCSECRINYWAKHQPHYNPNKLRYCKHCGKVITEKGRRYCSEECKKEAAAKRGIKLYIGKSRKPPKKNAIPMFCELCGTMFMPVSKRQRFCCKHCSKLAWNRNNKDKLKVYKRTWKNKHQSTTNI